MSRPQRYFGIVEDLSGNLGQGLIANSYSENNSVSVAESRDEKGKLLDLAAYSENHEITVDGLYVGEGVKAGDKLTIGGKDYLISTSNKNESNTDFVRGSVTMRCGDEDTVIWPLSGLSS